MDLQAVKRLRNETGLGIFTCQKALTKAQGNYDKAIEILRQEGIKIAHKQQGRTSQEGALFIAINEAKTKASLIGIQSNTDFVAKSEKLQTYGKQLAQYAITANHTTKEELLQAQYQDTTYNEALLQLSARSKEKLEVTQYITVQGKFIGSYQHSNRLGAVVALSERPTKPEDITIADHLAIQIVGNNPLAIDADSVDPTILDKERTSTQTQMEKAGKPPQIIERIIDTKIKKFLEENTLLGQPFILDQNKSVAQIIKQISPTLTITASHRLEMKST